MNNLIEKLKKYIRDETLVHDIISFLELNQVNENMDMDEIEDILNKLKTFHHQLTSCDLSPKKLNNVLIILNEIISIHNDHLMSKICDNI